MNRPVPPAILAGEGRAAPDSDAATAGVALDPAALAQLMPMYLRLDPAGNVLALGPTLQRLFPRAPLAGTGVFSLFEVRAPGRVETLADLQAAAGRRLHLVPRAGRAGLRLRGIVVGLEDGGLLLDLSFGLDITRAVGALNLTVTDFAPTEMAIELLCLAEANAVVMAEMRALGSRLDGARLQAEEEALTDPLTGLRNRRACDSFLSRLCREGAPFTLVHVDLDHFKQVNDTMGHNAGDHVLAEVGNILRNRARAMDCIARVGGDEFVLVLPGLADARRLASLCAQIVARVATPIPFQGRECHVAASIGTIMVPEFACPDPARILASADAALYAAKQAGRGCMVRAEDLGLGLDMPEQLPQHADPGLGGDADQG